jgi:hypothetical protein
MHKEIDTIERLFNDSIFTRSARVGTIDEKGRSVEAVFSTENPVMVFDYETYRVVEEVLLMDGMEFPEQIPFLDSHNRYSVKDQLGSGREIRVDGDKLIGRLYFGKSPDAEAAFSLVREGHITDVSIGYISKGFMVEEGADHNHNGRIFKGPVKLSTKTRVKEISLTPIGADEMAKIRSAITRPVDEQIRTMRTENEKLKHDLENAYSALRKITNKKGDSK